MSVFGVRSSEPGSARHLWLHATPGGGEGFSNRATALTESDARAVAERYQLTDSYGATYEAVEIPANVPIDGTWADYQAHQEMLRCRGRAVREHLALATTSDLLGELRRRLDGGVR